MKNPFGSWLESRIIRDYLTNQNIEAGDYSYYSGYYHDKPFEDHCVRYLLGDGSTREPRESGLWGEVDRLLIGKFCSIGSGATFMLAGNQRAIGWIVSPPSRSIPTPLAKALAAAFCARGTPRLTTMFGSARKR